MKTTDQYQIIPNQEYHYKARHNLLTMKRQVHTGLDVLEDGRKLGQAVAQQQQVLQGTCLKLIVKGQSYIEAGDVIEFKMRAIDEKATEGEEDPQFSGKYIITKVRHQINPTKYVMVLECAKDSVKSRLLQIIQEDIRETKTSPPLETHIR